MRAISFWRLLNEVRERVAIAIVFFPLSPGGSQFAKPPVGVETYQRGSRR
jgi:hypothetical protein